MFQSVYLSSIVCLLIVHTSIWFGIQVVCLFELQSTEAGEGIFRAQVYCCSWTYEQGPVSHSKQMQSNKYPLCKCWRCFVSIQRNFDIQKPRNCCPWKNLIFPVLFCKKWALLFPQLFRRFSIKVGFSANCDISSFCDSQRVCLLSLLKWIKFIIVQLRSWFLTALAFVNALLNSKSPFRFIALLAVSPCIPRTRLNFNNPGIYWHFDLAIQPTIGHIQFEFFPLHRPHKFLSCLLCSCVTYVFSSKIGPCYQ